METQITKKDIQNARLVYLWLLFTPILAVPCWAFSGLANSGDGFVNILGAALPLIFYAPVFIWAFAPNPYLKAHARQGVVLLFLRFCCGMLVGANIQYALVGNLILWLIGSLVGLAQAANGRAWIGNIHAEIINHAVPSRPAPVQDAQYYLSIFRTGDPGERVAALRQLEALGQVETF